MTLRLFRETDSGIEVSEGSGWRAPHEGEFVALDDGSNFLALNGETQAAAFWKGALAMALVAAAVFAVFAGWYAEHRG